MSSKDFESIDIEDSYLPSDVESNKRTFMGYTQFQTEDEEGGWIPPMDSEDVMDEEELKTFRNTQEMQKFEKE